MKAKKKNKAVLSKADIARLGPAARKAVEAEMSKGQKSEGVRQRAKRRGMAAAAWDSKQFEVSWYAPAVGRRVTYDRPVVAANKQGAVSEVRAWLNSMAFKEHKGVTNFVAKRINPAVLKNHFVAKASTRGRDPNHELAIVKLHGPTTAKCSCGKWNFVSPLPANTTDFQAQQYILNWHDKHVKLEKKNNPTSRVAAKAPRRPATAAQSPRRTSNMYGEVEEVLWDCPKCGFDNYEEFVKGKAPATLICGKCGKRSKRKAVAKKSNPQQKFSKATLAHLRREFGNIDGAKMEEHRAQFDKVFAQTGRPLLKQLADAKIEWVSSAARNAMVARRNPTKKQNMHPLEIGANSAIILSGLMEVRRVMQSQAKKKKRQPAKKRKNISGLITIAETIQAADFLDKRLGRKKKNWHDDKPFIIPFRDVKIGQKFRIAGFTAVFEKTGSGECKKVGKPSSGNTHSIKPTAGVVLVDKKRNPNDGRIFEKFTGKKSEQITHGFHTRKGEPTNVDELGNLTEIKLGSLTSGPILRFPYPAKRNGKTELVFDRSLIDERQKEINPKRIHYLPNWTKLCAKDVNGRERFVVGQRQPYFLDNNGHANKRLNYGPVAQVTYRASKPHILTHENGKPDKRIHNFYHNHGEEGGRQPRLVLDNGWWAFEGGDYTITREGIRD